MKGYRAMLPEDIVQQMVFEWAATMEYRYPCLRLMYHVPNEGKRSKAAGAKMKRMGLRRGVPDICLPVARGKYHGLYIELKTVGGRATSDQKDYLKVLLAEGYCSAVCFSAEEAEELILEYLGFGDFGSEVRG